MIDYKIISESIEFYGSNGYKRIESPWTVSEYVANLTRPEGAQPFKIEYSGKHLVASGEQSFLYLYLKDFLPKGSFQTITPCFRYESFDYNHSKYFIKNELIKTDLVDLDELNKLVDLSYKFFSKYLSNLDIKSTESGFDIEWKGNELGSYGIRENDFLKWIYGTGCAEPRLSRTINISKRNNERTID